MISERRKSMNQDIYYGFDRTDIEELILGMADVWYWRTLPDDTGVKS